MSREGPEITNVDGQAKRRLRIRYGFRAPAVVVHVAGEIDADSLLDLRLAMESTLTAAIPPFPIVLDLTEVTFLATTCLDALVRFHEQALKRRTPLLLVAAERSVFGVLTGAGLDQVLSIHPTVGSAAWSHHAAPARDDPARRPLRIDSTVRDDLVIVAPSGVLDLAGYAQLRTALLKQALEAPRAMIVDTDGLRLPGDSLLVVFTSVWMEVPVPLLLVAADDTTAARLRRNGITQFIPVHRTVEAATASLGEPATNRRAVFSIPPGRTRATVARQHIERTCGRWACAANAVSDARLIASELVENAMLHGLGAIRMRLELIRGKLTIAIYDDDPNGPRVTAGNLTNGRLGLALFERLAYTWGCARTPAGGNVVWAILQTGT
jgi:anti-anti-sigma factor